MRLHTRVPSYCAHANAISGPLELTRRQKVLVWDDEVDIADERLPEIVTTGPSPVHPPPASPRASINTMPVTNEPRRHRSQSTSDFPPPMRRVSTEYSRPVSFSKKFSKIHPATTGVTVLEHMERLDAVEAGLKRLGVEETVFDDDEEVDVGEVSRSKKPAKPRVRTDPSTPEDSTAAAGLLSPSAMSERLPSVPENGDEDARSFTEEDLVAMSKSMSHLEQPQNHTRWTSDHARAERNNLDWMQDPPESPKKRTVIVEVSLLFAERRFMLTTAITAAGDGQYQTFLLMLVMNHGLLHDSHCYVLWGAFMTCILFGLL